MSWPRVLRIAVVWATSLRWAEAQVPPPIVLPPDSSAAVIVFDDISIYGYSTRVTDAPMLTIRADGQVKIQNTYSNSPPLEAMLTPAELQDLLRFAIDEQGFFSFPPSGSYKPLLPELENASLRFDHFKKTLIRIRTADREHQSIVDLSSTGEASEQFDALERKLLRVIQEIRAGGRDRVAEALRALNASLSQKNPEVPPFGADDFLHSYPVDAQRGFTFQRILDESSWQRATIDYIPGGTSQIRTSTEPREPGRMAALVEFLRELKESQSR